MSSATDGTIETSTNLPCGFAGSDQGLCYEHNHGKLHWINMCFRKAWPRFLLQAEVRKDPKTYHAYSHDFTMDIGSRATTDGIHIEQWSTANRHNNRPHTKFLVRAVRGAELRPHTMRQIQACHQIDFRMFSWYSRMISALSTLPFVNPSETMSLVSHQ